MPSPVLETEGKKLLAAARKSIAGVFSKKEKEDAVGENEDRPLVFKEKRGVFVTLHKNGQLRGCIGNLIPEDSLEKSVVRNAQRAAFHDRRFIPLKKEELDGIQIELSILTPMQKISYADTDDLIRQIRPGVDGVLIEKGPFCATFLPQVWEQIPTHEQFFEQLCLKAGLPPDTWISGEMEIHVYQVQSFEEPAPEAEH